MATRMTHPKHGITFAVGNEIDWNITNGWVVNELPKSKVGEAPTIVKADTFDSQVVTESVNRDNLSDQYESKFGKKPHHLMKASTIEDALKDS